MQKAIRYTLLVVLAAVLLFAIGMATRMPAMRLGINYGLHAVLAAFFYAAVVAMFELKTGRCLYVALGSLLVSVVLGMMSPVMAVAGALPALAYFVAFCVMNGGLALDGARDVRSAVVCGTVFATFAYVGTIVGGIVFSGYKLAVNDLPFLLLTIGLGLLGSLVGTWIVGKMN